MIRIALIILALTASPALAQSVEEQVRSQLSAQGFTEIDMRRTLLGRLRVVATSETHRREIVINPGSGAILRDYWEERDGDDEDDDDGVRVFIPDGADGDRRDDEDDDDRDDDRADREDEEVRRDDEDDDDEDDDDDDTDDDDSDDEDDDDDDDGEDDDDDDEDDD
ncbi:PepSY domain-containing protein [Salibaculum halophilum]|uniref:PepSY domain-containing protein n=1 Tax=Salibaculum halophilum TaxID=1914408 RepID=UPI0015C4870A|nr:PepSY domain-containing protein [Salibaculum halophilum]